MKFIMAQITESKILDDFINLELVEAPTEKKAKLLYAKKHKLSKHFVRMMAFKTSNNYWFFEFGGYPITISIKQCIVDNDLETYQFFNYHPPVSQLA